MEWWTETDRFHCTAPDGQTIEVIVRQKVSEVSVSLTYGAATYSTSSGELVERIDGNVYALPDGRLLVRTRRR